MALYTKGLTNPIYVIKEKTFFTYISALPFRYVSLYNENK